MDTKGNPSVGVVEKRHCFWLDIHLQESRFELHKQIMFKERVRIYFWISFGFFGIVFRVSSGPVKESNDDSNRRAFQSL